MVKFVLSVFHALLVVAVSYGGPISVDDAASLLPEAPKTQNKTVEAIVKDTVVQNAVDSLVGDGSLHGLVVKKNIVILPASEPEVILTQTEQILTAPTSHLESIRKNITDTVAAVKENSAIAEIDDVTVAEVIPQNDQDGSNPKAPKEETETLPKVVVEITQEGPATTASSSSVTADVPTTEPTVVSSTASSIRVILPEEFPQIETIHPDRKFVVPGINQTEIKLPEGIKPQTIQLPTVIDQKISLSVLALVHGKNTTNNHGSVISLLPVIATSSTDSAKNSPEDSTTPSTGADLDQPLVKIEATYRYSTEDSPTSISKARPDIGDKNYDYERESDDMAVAADMIFRPLFRYRQQQSDRIRLFQQRNYQNQPYRRYRPYRPYESNDYPGYGYRQSKYYDD